MTERDSSLSELEFTERITGNPIHAFNMVKRFAIDWKLIEKDLQQQNTDWQDMVFELKKRRLKTVQLKEQDLHQSAQVY